ncbi:MAG: hypothetical protein V7765_19985, partial [Oleispira sp.]
MNRSLLTSFECCSLICWFIKLGWFIKDALFFNRDLLALTMEIEFCTARREPIHGGSLKDPSFRRPTKLIAIVHRKSLLPFETESPFSDAVRAT